MEGMPEAAVSSKRRNAIRFVCPALLFLRALGANVDAAEHPPKTVLRTERFDKDPSGKDPGGKNPGWEGLNNRIVPTRLPTVTQDFGYSPTSFAGKEKGKSAAASGGPQRQRIMATRSP